MTHTPDLEERIVVSALGVLAGIVYLFYTRRSCLGHSRAASYLVGIGSGHDVVAAVIVGACTLSMAAIAWRLASAPLQLTGDDPAKERIEERASRALRSGMSCVLAIAIIFVFSSFSLKGVTSGLPIEHEILTLSFAMWIVIGLATVLYAWSIKRSLRAKTA